LHETILNLTVRCFHLQKNLHRTLDTRQDTTVEQTCIPNSY